MRLNLFAASAAAAVLGLAWLALPAEGNFAAVTGFSGRLADCSACHNRPLPGMEATVTLEGLPAAYAPGESYALRITVHGGPPAMPAPLPQGGFELETDQGTFQQPPDMEDLLRSPEPHVVTYEPAGTLRRSWDVVWQAPGLDREPRPARFWLAAVAASGDHVVATNTSVLGERFDSVATLTATVQAEAAAQAAWEAMPLRPPQVDDVRVRQGVAVVRGMQQDGNATQVRHRVGDGPWGEVAAADRFRVDVVGLAPGVHVLELQAAGSGRASTVVAVGLPVTGPSGAVPEPSHAAPFPFAAAAALAAAACIQTRRNPR